MRWLLVKKGAKLQKKYKYYRPFFEMTLKTWMERKNKVVWSSRPAMGCWSVRLGLSYEYRFLTATFYHWEKTHKYRYLLTQICKNTQIQRVILSFWYISPTATFYHKKHTNTDIFSNKYTKIHKYKELDCLLNTDIPQWHFPTEAQSWSVEDRQSLQRVANLNVEDLGTNVCNN